MAPPKTPNAKRGTIHGSITNNLAKFTIRAAPLPSEIVGFLQDNLAILKRMGLEQSATADFSSNRIVDTAEQDEGVDLQGEIIKKPTVQPSEFWDVLHETSQKVGGEWANIANQIWAFGPQRAGSCVLIDNRADGISIS